jgi:hypothetical protein
VTKVFGCESSSVSQFYRYIRLTQTGKSSCECNYLMLGNIEFFGTMVNSSNHHLVSHPRSLHSYS